MKTPHRGFLICSLTLALASAYSVHAAPSDAISPTIPMGSLERAEANGAKDLLDRAVAYLREKGTDEAFKAFSDPKGAFAKDQYYVYVLGLDGTMAAHGAVPDVLVGTNVADMRDAAGKAFVRELLDKAASDGTGTVKYLWLNRANNHLEMKTTFFKKVGQHVVSVGYYVPLGSPEETDDLLNEAVAKMKTSGASGTFKEFNDPMGR